MADHYVICEPCVGVKDKACQEICPVDCIVESCGGEFPEMLFIHPEECICCSVCEPECPVNAIYQAEDVPEEWAQFVQLAADFFKAR